MAPLPPVVRPTSSSFKHSRDPFIAVTHAALSNWEYMEIIRLAAPPKCSKHLQNSIQTIDSILSTHGALVKPLKGLFGLGELKHDEDFVAVLEVSCLLQLLDFLNDGISRVPSGHGSLSVGTLHSTVTRSTSSVRRLINLRLALLLRESRSWSMSIR